MTCGMAISSPNIPNPEVQLDREVHHVEPDNVAEKVVVGGGDDRVEPVEVAGVVVCSNSRPTQQSIVLFLCKTVDR